MAHPGGRPTDYRPEYCAIVRKLLAEGAAKIEIAAELGVNRKTIERWAEEHQEFRDTIYDGLENSECWWVRSGRLNLGNKDFNSRLYELNMMNRFGWKRKAEGDHKVVVSQEDALKELE